MALHRVNARLVGTRVEAKAARRAARLQEAVPLLPRPEQLRRDADAPAQSADPQLRRLVHAHTLHKH